MMSSRLGMHEKILYMPNWHDPEQDFFKKLMPKSPPCSLAWIITETWNLYMFEIKITNNPVAIPVKETGTWVGSITYDGYHMYFSYGETKEEVVRKIKKFFYNSNILFHYVLWSVKPPYKGKQNV
jgi:hypothetical protein